MKKEVELEQIKLKIVPILIENKITKAGIFGSYARGENTINSDIDILVEVNQDFGLLEIIRLKRLLQKATTKKVDLVEYENIRPEIKNNILTDEIPILI